MLKTSKTPVILLVLIGLLGVASVALAEHDDDHPEDTLFSFGYDDLNHFLAINIGPNDTLYQCIFANDTLQATYGEPDETSGLIPVAALDDETDAKEFLPRTREGGLAEEFEEEAIENHAYNGADNHCGVNGVVVAGPNGQVNHGQFMKAAKSLFDIKGGGCVVRHLAKSSIGKGNDPTHVTVSEAEGFVFGGAGTMGDIDFTTEEVDCYRGKKDRGTAAASSSNGRTKGKSADAPGHNK